ncbi:MAG: flavin reductase, partial [Clostridia bacterium]|nr:flavin reductase [Clostridia bacterium]
MSNVMRNLTYGLFVLSVNCHKKDNACIINTAIQAASTPDKICISVNKANHTCDMLGYVEDFTLSVISE